MTGWDDPSLSGDDEANDLRGRIMDYPNKVSAADFISDVILANPWSITLCVLGLVGAAVAVWKIFTNFSSVLVPIGLIAMIFLPFVGMVIGTYDAGAKMADEVEAWALQTYGVDVDVDSTRLDGLADGSGSMTVIDDGVAYDLVLTDDKLILIDNDGHEAERVSG